MRKDFGLRIFFWVIMLAAVLAVMVTTMNNKFITGTRQTAQSQTLLEQFFISGGPIVWFILLPMSVVMVYLAAEYSLTIRRKKLLPAGICEQITEMIRQFDLVQLPAKISDNSDLVSIAVVKALTQGRGDWFRMKSAAAESLQEQAMALMRRIEWINLIGNVSPMVGLFGTVVGMIQLFNAIVAAGGQPQPAQLAGGISVALVTTFWGLLIAISALTVYGVFQNRIETLVNDAVPEAENVLSHIRRCLEKISRPEQPKSKQPIREVESKSTELERRSPTSL